ncbi:Rv1535 domain-containing protein [Mycobacterium shimoidei]|uniref:Rv1535 domain-containing protein n=1 Tax=Mycobacterium shimoidei TaxID=29313 RepID=UPI0035566401
MAALLIGPVTQLYAALWRVGVVEVGHTRRPADPVPATLRVHQASSGWPLPARRLPPRLVPAPGPSPPARAAYSRAAGSPPEY